MRAAWWAWTGGAIGVYCGMIVGALHGIAATTLAFLAALFASLLYASPLNAAFALLPIVILTGFVGGFLGAILGGITGMIVFFVLSCSPHRYVWPMLLDRLAHRVEKKCLPLSFIGAFCAVTSAALVCLGLRQNLALQVVPIAAYILGAIGGFAVGLFIGARNIIRENAAPTSSTRSVE